MSTWIQHVKDVARRENIKYGEALKIASKTWNKTGHKVAKKPKKAKVAKAAVKKSKKAKVEKDMKKLGGLLINLLNGKNMRV